MTCTRLQCTDAEVGWGWALCSPETKFGSIVAELSPGFFFGESSLVNDQPRSATCLAGDQEVSLMQFMLQLFLLFFIVIPPNNVCFCC